MHLPPGLIRIRFDIFKLKMIKDIEIVLWRTPGRDKNVNIANRMCEFGPFRLDFEKRRLTTRDGRVVPLTPRCLDLLLLLAENPGRVVDRDQLLARVWPDVKVEEANLTQAVWMLRRDLKLKDENGSTFIETVPRQGYRFVGAFPQVATVPDNLSLFPGPVTNVSEAPEGSPASTFMAQVSKRRIFRFPIPAFGFVFLCLFMLAGVFVYLFFSPPINQKDATRFYAEGLEELRRCEASAARDHLQRAVAARPDDPLPHAALARAYSLLGHNLLERDESRKAFALSGDLPREERLTIESQVHEANTEWDKAVGTLEELRTSFPDNLEHGLRLARVQTLSGRYREAAGTIESLRKQRPSFSEGLRLDLQDADLAYHLGDYARQERLAGQVVERATLIPAAAFLAQGYFNQARAFWRQGNLDRASRFCAKARIAFQKIEDQKGLALSLNLDASIELVRGDYPRAQSLFEEAMALQRRIGDVRGLASSLHNFSNVVHRQGDHLRAKKIVEESVAAFREAGDRVGLTYALDHAARFLMEEGDLAAAERAYEEVLTLRQEYGTAIHATFTPATLAWIQRCRGNLDAARMGLEKLISSQRQSAEFRPLIGSLVYFGYVVFSQGDLAAARAAFEEARDRALEARDPSDGAGAASGLAMVFRAQGNLAGAQAEEEKGLALREEIGELEQVSSSRLELALLAIDQGDFAKARRLALQTAAEFRRFGDPEGEAESWAAVAKALLAEGKASESREALDQAAGLLQHSQNILLKLDLAILEGRVALALGDPTGARQQIDFALSEASRRGIVPIRFEAELARLQLDLFSSRKKGGALKVTQLETEASAKGFNLVAQKASSFLVASNQFR